MKDIDMLEKCKVDQLNSFPGLEILAIHEERLKECGLTTSDKRRLRAVKYKFFKYIYYNGHENVDHNIIYFFKLGQVNELEDITSHK